MRAEIAERKELVLRIEKTDSMGRTRAQRLAMEKNDPRPINPGEGALQVAAICETEHREYPKAMYRLALRNGKPAGDVANPDYPMPYDIALQIGLADQGFKVLNRTTTSPGNVVVRLPWITRSVGTVRDDLSVDIEAARAEEARLRKLGWVDSPSQIKGLPVPPAEQEYDALPDGNGHTRA